MIARMTVSFDLKGKVALVTGASRGIGYGLAQALAAAGARVAVAARTQAELEPLAASIGGLAIELDVRRIDSIQAAVERVVRELGSLDILVNNAGLGASVERSLDTPLDEFMKVLNVDLVSPWLLGFLLILTSLAIWYWGRR